MIIAYRNHRTSYFQKENTSEIRQALATYSGTDEGNYIVKAFYIVLQMSLPNYSSVGQWVLWVLLVWQLLWCFTHTPVFTVVLQVDWS